MPVALEPDVAEIVKVYRVSYNFSIQVADHGKVRCHVYDRDTDRRNEHPYITVIGGDQHSAVHAALRKVPTTPKPLPPDQRRIADNIERARLDAQRAEIARLKTEIERRKGETAGVSGRKAKAPEAAEARAA